MIFSGNFQFVALVFIIIRCLNAMIRGEDFGEFLAITMIGLGFLVFLYFFTMVVHDLLVG